MSRTGRPQAVESYWRQWLWLTPAVVAVLTFAFFYNDLPATRPTHADNSGEIAVVGTVVARGAFGGETEVRYFHPVTEQEVTVEVVAHDRSLVPATGRQVQLVVDRNDPLDVSIDGDRRALTLSFLAYGAWVAAAIAPAALRRGSIWRTERFMAGGTTFAMLGAISARHRHRCELHLYALDAAPSSPPLCTVPLLTTGQAPLGKVFPVEVKGSPRPFGRVVARANGRVLWPTRRAGRRREFPRPQESIPAVAGLPPLERSLDLRLEPAGWPWPTLTIPLGALVASLIIFGITAGISANNASDARRIQRNGVLVVGEIVGRTGDDSLLVLRYHRGGKEETTRAAVDFATDYPKGMRYPVRLDPYRPERGRLVTEPYDTTEPLVWAGFPVVVAALVAGRCLTAIRRARTLARVGPLRKAAALQPDPDDPGIALANASGDRVCGAIVEDQSLLRDDEPVIVGGMAEPGMPIALWRSDGTPVLVAPRATSDAMSAYDSDPSSSAADTADPTAPLLRRTVLSSRPQRAFVAILLGCCGGAIGALIGSLLASSATSDVVVNVVVIACGVVAGLPSLIRGSLIGLTVADGEIVVRNALRTYTIPRISVLGFSTALGSKGQKYVGVRRSTGPDVPVVALPLFQTVPSGRFSKGSRQRMARVRAIAAMLDVPVDFDRTS